VLTGNSTANVLTGGAGSDTLIGGLGNDSLSGGTGNDTYLIAKGNGQDTVSDNDTTAGNLDVLKFGAGINQTNLWLKHVGKDLEIDLLGTTDKVTIQNWYTSTTGSATNAAWQIERIKTDDGLTMYNTDVEKLVQAMAAFAPPTAATTSWTSGATQNGKTLLTVTH
jgi:hypothetical protein